MLFISAICYASNYKVETKVDQFIVYEDEPVIVEIIIKSIEKNWIVDISERSKPFENECTGEEGDEFSSLISVVVDGLGLKEIGPYEFKFGDEVIKTSPIKIYKIQRKTNPQDFEIISKKDPNGSGRYHIKIEYSATKEKLGLHVLEIDHEHLPRGVKFKSGSSSIINGRVSVDITLEKTQQDIVILTKYNFFDIPAWIDFPSIKLE